MHKKYIGLLVIIILAGITATYVFIWNNKKTDYLDTGFHSASTNGRITLEYYIWSDEESYVVPVVEAYNAIQNAAYINVHIIEENYESTVKAMLESDTDTIDLLGVRGISLATQLGEEGEVMDLSNELKSSNVDVTAYGTMFNDISSDGSYYGMPTRCTCWELFYNKTLFDEAGLPYPEQMTWEEYASLAKQLTDKEKGIWGGYLVNWTSNFLAVQQSSYLIDDDISKSKESLLFLNRLYNEDKSHVPYKEMKESNDDYLEAFCSGKIAMMPNGEWVINSLLAKEKKNGKTVEWDVAPMPVSDGQEAGTTWGQYQFAAIASKTKYPNEAFSFIEFLCGEEGAKIYAQNGMLHAYSSDEIRQMFMETVGKKSVSVFLEAKLVQEQLAIPGYREIVELFQQQSDDYLGGIKSVDWAMKDFEEGRLHILKE